MKKWKFPLHFIDFETSTPAIPFTRGRRPYGEVAFQFSHHIVREDGTVEHAGEHLEERRLTFPNYDFLRKLREELSKDEGSLNTVRGVGKRVAEIALRMAASAK